MLFLGIICTCAVILNINSYSTLEIIQDLIITVAITNGYFKKVYPYRL